MRAALLSIIVLFAACAAFATRGVQAEAKPPTYTIVEIDILDPEHFQAFAKRNAAGVAAAGRLFLAMRGRIATSEYRRRPSL